MTIQACRSLNEIMPGNFDREKLPIFASQHPECVFTRGACHVFAIALYERLVGELPDVRVFHLLAGEYNLKHVVVGRPGDRFIDVRLQWQTLAQFGTRWGQDFFFADGLTDGLNPTMWKERREQRLARFTIGAPMPGITTQRGPIELCDDDLFVAALRAVADRFLCENDATVKARIAEEKYRG